MTWRMASGSPASSRRHVGEVLDLAHHVVAEIPDEAPVQRGQTGENGRTVGAEHGVDGGEDPLVGARLHLGGQLEGALGA